MTMRENYEPMTSESLTRFLTHIGAEENSKPVCVNLNGEHVPIGLALVQNDCVLLLPSRSLRSSLERKNQSAQADVTEGIQQ